MTTHQQAREHLHNAFFEVFLREPTLLEMQCAQAIAWLETQYGDGWGPHDSGFGSNNWGAVQAGANWTGATFEHIDTHPNGDGTSTPYVTRFRLYPTPQMGAADLVRAVYQWHGRSVVLDAAVSGNVHGVSEELYATGYYEGFGPTPAARIENHHRAVVAAMRVFCRALNEPLPAQIDQDAPQSTRPTLTIGTTGESVQLLQRRLGLADDGIFGPLTRAAVIQFQRDHGLTVDGWVGAATWAALDEAEPVTQATRKTLPSV